MKLYATWQPLVNEDAQTALVFGMLRHLPVERALIPWLQGVLGRAVKAEPLRPDSFWPRYDSVFDGANWTEPELVSEIDDGEPLLVIVENKPGFSGHRLEQLAREAVDTAKTEEPRRASRSTRSSERHRSTFRPQCRKRRAAGWPQPPTRTRPRNRSSRVVGKASTVTDQTLTLAVWKG